MLVYCGRMVPLCGVSIDIQIFESMDPELKFACWCVIDFMTKNILGLVRFRRLRLARCRGSMLLHFIFVVFSLIFPCASTSVGPHNHLVQSSKFM